MANPKLRFKSAINDNIGWKQVRLNELGVFISGQTYNRSCVTNNESDVLIIRSSNLQDLEYVDVCNDLQFVSIDIPSEKYLKENDVVICTANGSTNLVGKASIYDGSYHGLISWGAFCSVFRSNNVLAKFFFRTPKYRTLIHAHKQGGNGSLGNLNVSAISSEEIFFPESTNEQHKIAEFFTALDEKIQFLGKKLKLKHSLKHSMMDKVFTQKVRFKSDTSEPFKDWMALELGSFCSFYAGQTPKSTCSDYYGGEINWVASGDLNRGVIFNTEKTITNAGLNSANLKIIPKGSFVIALFGLEAENVCGNCGLLGIDAAINQACLNIRPNEEILLTKYLFYYYQHFGKSFCKSNAQGTKQQNLNIELISQFAIKIPCIEEQRKICAFFDQIEKSILLLDRKLCCLKELKKAFMQRMFV